jgi:hypothetical protein
VGAIQNLETAVVQVAFVLELYDGITGLPALAGSVLAEVASHEIGYQKPNTSQFVFFTLTPGTYIINVTSNQAVPYYEPANIAVAVPAPGTLWPAFPDRTVADPTKLLDDPGQTPAYLAQRAQATLMPTAQYPFAAGATLARGTVRAAGVPLAGAQVTRVGGPEQYVTAVDGQYVLVFDSVDGMGQAVTLQSAHAPYANQQTAVTLLRGFTITQDFAMV